MDDRTAPHTNPEGVDVPRGTLDERHTNYQRIPADERRMMVGVPTSCEPPFARVGCGVLLLGIAAGYAIIGAVIAVLWRIFS